MEEMIHLVNEMSPYLLLGFFLAGLMHAFVPRTLYSRYLSAHGFRSVLYAALLGIPLPLCSCGVIPTAMSLRREGASKGATVSFLVATPQTGVDSIVATFSLMGLPFAIIRPIVALVTALFAGLLVDGFDRAEAEAKPGDKGAGHAEAPHAHGEPCSCKGGFISRMKEALHYAFVEMMQDIGKWLVIGLVVAGLITLLVPDSFFALFAGHSLLSILFVLLFSIPMYLCATGSIPIAVALMLKGLTPGAALVLLMAGPASNAASILVIHKVLGRRSLLLYLLAIVGGAVAFGLGIDALLPASWFAVSGAGVATDCCTAAEGACSVGPDWIGWGCTIVLALLLMRAFALRYFAHETGCHCHGACEHQAEPRLSAVRRFHVEGMSCNHCRTNVEKVLQSLPGVTHAEVHLAEEQALVEGDCPDDTLIQAVKEIGFEMHR